ncbi:hypothetical protein [Piscibacillus salipiscarius]|uniref:YtxH domain-containing protein n=1 Tax=Piscibacillus salipiscarius TaxID=299480 RepID=A0ABW5QCV4_9BACI|nr:hypothetical protein [Piscibacillus salipiscarius]
MRKGIMTTLVAAGSAAVGAYIFSDENRKSKIKGQYQKVKNQLLGEQTDPIEKAGKPEEVSHHEDSKMVSEGAQFGVQYYNEVKEDDEKEETHTK